MTVKELIDHLKTFPPDTEVICSRYSDYMYLTAEEITLVQGACYSDYMYLTAEEITLVQGADLWKWLDYPLSSHHA